MCQKLFMSIFSPWREKSKSMETINKINELYKSEEGDKLAVAELVPLAEKHVSVVNPQILEIGCGYGRNLFALSHVRGSEVSGCDISSAELQKAQDKMDKYQVKNVSLVLQSEYNKLPFADSRFDLVVMWQVLEHILSDDGKAALLNEAARVLKSGGHILIETPNRLFPFDYHDNNLPFAHWILPEKWRRWITIRIRHEDFPPSQYMTIFQIRKILQQSPHVKSFEQKTKIYFEESYGDIFRHLGGTRIKFKVIFFVLYAPVYCILRLLGLPGDCFTPSLRVIFKIIK